MNIRIEKLSQANFKDYESLTSCQKDGGCYCAFWHQKWNSLKEWEDRQASEPLRNRDTVLNKVDSGFHVGVLAYQGDELLAWISVGPLPEYYWTWKRVAALGEEARLIAGITCITIAEKYRGQALQPELLRALNSYGKTQGWAAIEGYPFDESAYLKHGKTLAWPGNPKGFAKAGYERIEAHWMNNAGYERSIFRKSL